MYLYRYLTAATLYDLDIDMCCILKAEEWIVGDHPPIVHREMLPTNHIRMGESPVGWLSAAVLNSKVTHRRALTKGLWELLLTAPFHTGARHTRRVDVDSSAGASRFMPVMILCSWGFLTLSGISADTMQSMSVAFRGLSSSARIRRM